MSTTCILHFKVCQFHRILQDCAGEKKKNNKTTFHNDKENCSYFSINVASTQSYRATATKHKRQRQTDRETKEGERTTGKGRQSDLLKRVEKIGVCFTKHRASIHSETTDMEQCRMEDSGER